MIRLRRHGARRDPHYRVVVTEDSDSRDGRFLEIVGHYHPRKQPAEIVLDVDRTEAWLGKGATMSDTVASLYRRVKSGKVEGAVAVADVAEDVADEPAAEPEAAEEAGATAAAAAQEPAEESTDESSDDSDGDGGEEE